MNRYETPVALRRALEDRIIAQAAKAGGDIQRLRRQAAFDRLLCRLFQNETSPWLLKGGYAMELRIRAARTTRDIDLALRKSAATPKEWNIEAVTALLRQAAAINLEDGFEFTIGDATLDLDAAPYGGARFTVLAQMAGRQFAQFHVDVSSGDVLREPYEMLEGRDWFGFAGLPRARVPAVSPEEQFAEKLHAYTLPRTGSENSRVKDLVDLVLLIEQAKLNVSRLGKSIRETFQRRNTHSIPTALAPPPASWAARFSEMAEECGIDADIHKHFAAVEQFYQKLNL
ncbi:MAG: nucleotidyl transferase AbiEii/AbiGii toxin family protein [Verrucomicrobiota bacterium]